MNTLRTLGRCKREMYVERLLDRESLNALNSSDEDGKYIGHSVETIIANLNAIKEQQNSKEPDTKKINRAKENIELCKTTIKTRLSHLGATPDDVKTVFNCLDKCDYQQVTLKVLEVMKRKNPGLHTRKYEEALALIEAKKQQVTQPQH